MVEWFIQTERSTVPFSVKPDMDLLTPAILSSFQKLPNALMPCCWGYTARVKEI